MLTTCNHTSYRIVVDDMPLDTGRTHDRLVLGEIERDVPPLQTAIYYELPIKKREQGRLSYA